MRAEVVTWASMAVLLIVASGAAAVGCSEAARLRAGWGASVAVELEPGMKLESVEFQANDEPWLLVRHRRPNEPIEEHVFYALESTPTGRRQYIVKERR